MRQFRSVSGALYWYFLHSNDGASLAKPSPLQSSSFFRVKSQSFNRGARWEEDVLTLAEISKALDQLKPHLQRELVWVFGHSGIPRNNKTFGIAMGQMARLLRAKELLRE